MKIALITYDFFTRTGGMAQTLDCMYKAFKKDINKLFIFNPYAKGKDIFNFPVPFERNVNYLKIMKNRDILLYASRLIFKLLREKDISISNRLTMILYLFLIPKHSLRTLYNLKFIFPIIKKLDIDIIFGDGTGPSLLLIFSLSRLLNKRVVAFSHGNDFLIRAPISFKSIYMRNLDMILLSNKRMVKLIKKIHNISNDKLFIINRGLILSDYFLPQSKQELRKKIGISSNDFILLTVCRLVERKKVDLVIKALKSIINEIPTIKIKYYIIGTGPESTNLHNLTKKLNLENEVKLLGNCESTKRNEYYKMSDVFLMPSVSEKTSIEGFGIVFLEASYFEIPIIGAKSGGIFEAIIDGITGYLVEPNNVEDLIEKIKFLYENPEIREKMGKKGRERVEYDFDWQKSHEKMLELFNDLLKRK